MKKLLLAMSLSTVVLGACGDGVPRVEDPHNVIVDGQKMKQSDFLRKFCVAKVQNETCLRVQQAMRDDATKGPLPPGW